MVKVRQKPKANLANACMNLFNLVTVKLPRLNEKTFKLQNFFTFDNYIFILIIFM